MGTLDQPIERAGTGGARAGPGPVASRSPGPIRVGLVDDHHLVREGLSLVISTAPGYVVAGEAADEREAFELIERQRPDVILLDLSLGESDGLSLLRGLKARRPDVRVVVLTMHEDGETVRQSLLAGADGYLVKGARASELFAAIQAVLRSERYLHSTVTQPIVDDSIRWQRSGDQLTPREREVLALLAAGRSPAQIGGSIGISVFTVRRHIANLAGKLNLHGAAALRRYAEAHGIYRGESGTRPKAD